MTKFNRHALAVWSGNVMHSLGWMMVLGLTGTFTILLFSHYAPPQAPYVPFLALAVCELGVIHWQHFLKHNAKTVPQLLVAGIMLALSILAIALCTGLELTSMFVLGGNIDLFLPALRTTALISLVLVTIFNVLAFCLISVSHPETLRRLTRIAATPITMTLEEAEQNGQQRKHSPTLLENSCYSENRTGEQQRIDAEQHSILFEQGVDSDYSESEQPQPSSEKREIIYQYLSEHPQASITDIVNYANVSRSYASTVRSRMWAEQAKEKGHTTWLG